MKVVILAGGLGTRLAEETEIKPKPMVEIGGRPILWHIMKPTPTTASTSSSIALGYKGEVIKRYFLDYAKLKSNLTVDLATGDVMRRGNDSEDWTVHLIDTGMQTTTGGRIKRLGPLLGQETFLLTYGDGVCDVDLRELLAFHRWHGKLATVTAVRPPARFGGLVFDGDRSSEFTEKPQTGEGWINGGFFVLEPGVFDYIEGDETSLETRAAGAAGRRGPADGLSARRLLAVHGHAARPAPARRPLGERQGALEGLGMTARSVTGHDRPVFVTGGTGLRRLLAGQGGWSTRRRRRVPGARPGSPERARPQRGDRPRDGRQRRRRGLRPL